VATAGAETAPRTSRNNFKSQLADSMQEMLESWVGPEGITKTGSIAVSAFVEARRTISLSA
jgi:hypothetical protein